jgi:hypothetical protein
MHGDGLDAQLAAGAQDAQGDLAAVGDDDLFRAWRGYSMMNSGWPNSTGSPFLASMAVTVAGLVGLDLVHHLHGFDDAQHLADLDLAADLDEGLGAGDVRQALARRAAPRGAGAWCSVRPPGCRAMSISFRTPDSSTLISFFILRMSGAPALHRLRSARCSANRNAEFSRAAGQHFDERELRPSAAPAASPRALAISTCRHCSAGR